MKTNTKSSITLPPAELKTVERLMRVLKAKSKVEVVRRGLKLIEQQVDREILRDGFRQASLAVREDSRVEVEDDSDLIDPIPS